MDRYNKIIVSLTPISNQRIAWPELDDTDQVIDLCKQGQIDGICISPVRKDRPTGGRSNGYTSRNICFLERIKDCAISIIIPEPNLYDIDVLYDMRGITQLRLGDNCPPFDCRKLFIENLRVLDLTWSSKITLPEGNNYITSLNLTKYNSRHKNLTDLPAYSNLRTLDLVQSNIANCDGIQQFPKLDIFSLAYNSKLNSILSIQASLIEKLWIQNCKNIKNIRDVVHCSNLKSLRYNDCGQIDSIQFIENCKKLEEFIFVNTFIADGNLSPLFRLKHVAFNDKRNYSHTNEEIDKIIADGNI